MVRDWVADHFFQYVLVLAVIAILLGIVATYLISFVLGLIKLMEIFFMTWSGGTSG